MGRRVPGMVFLLALRLCGQGGGAVAITGKVLMPDGGPPPEPLQVQLFCADMIDAPGGQTNQSGEFSLPLRRMPAELGQDSSLPRLALRKCAVEVAAPGFHRAVKTMEDGRFDLGGDVGSIRLVRAQPGALSVVSWKSLNAPKEARAQFERGLEASSRKRWEEARASFERALSAYPAYAQAWFELGRMYEARQQRDQAAEAFRNAVGADPDYLGPQVHLTLMAASANRWELSEKLAAAILSRAPEGLPGVYLVHAAACLNLQKFRCAVQSAKSGIVQDTGRLYPRLFLLLGDALAAQSQKSEARVAYEQYLKLAGPQGSGEALRKLQAVSSQ